MEPDFRGLDLSTRGVNASWADAAGAGSAAPVGLVVGALVAVLLASVAAYLLGVRRGSPAGDASSDLVRTQVGEDEVGAGVARQAQEEAGAASQAVGRARWEAVAALGEAARTPIAAMNAATDLLAEIDSPAVRQEVVVLRSTISALRAVVDDLSERVRIELAAMNTIAPALDAGEPVLGSAQAALPGQTAGLSWAHLAGRAVLVVDDNVANLRVLDRQLSSWGMACRSASTAADALETLGDDNPCDVVLLDAAMPGTTAADLAAAIRAVPGRRSLPLVLLTGAGELTPELAAIFAGHVTKPAKSAVVRDVVASVVTGQAPDSAALEPAPLPGLSVSELPTDGEGRANPPLRVLLAEDNPVNQRVAQLILLKLGHEVDVVSDGRQAVAAAIAKPYDVILMDIQMPEMDGREAASQIRASLQGEPQPRIIAMTASVLVEDRDACTAAGMDDYLSKPVRSVALRAALDGIEATAARRAAWSAAPTSDSVEASASDGTTVDTPAPDLASAPAAPTGTDFLPPHAFGTGPQWPTTLGRESVSVAVAPAAEEPPAVDEAALNKLVAQLDPRGTGLREVLVSSYLDDASTQVSRLLMAAANADLPTVASISHTLRSTSAMLGAAHLATLLQSAEDAARGESTDMVPLAREIDIEHARVVVELTRIGTPVPVR